MFTSGTIRNHWYVLTCYPVKSRTNELLIQNFSKLSYRQEKYKYYRGDRFRLWTQKYSQKKVKSNEDKDKEVQVIRKETVID